MSRIQNIPLNRLEENPHRQLHTYPTIERKVEALMRSFEDVGVWEGIIARPAVNAYQVAFGHHRLVAAQRVGLTEIPVIVRELTDEEMLKFMGRENGEDYSTEFLVMLNTWEGAVKFRRDRAGKSKPLVIASLLGWTRTADGPGARMNETALACASAHALLEGGHIGREKWDGLSVRDSLEVANRAWARMEQIEKSAKATNRPRKEVEAAKKHVAKGAEITIRKVKEGQVAQKDIRGEVDVNAFKSAATSKIKNTPLFAVFGKALCDSLEKRLATDKDSEKLDQIAKAVNQVTMEEDTAVLRQLDYQLSELGIRTEGWRKRLIPNREKIVGLPALEKKDA